MFKSGLLFVFCIAVAGCVHHHPHSHPHTHPELGSVVIENPGTGDETVVHLPAVVSGEPVVYCKHCGVAPGKSSNCPRFSAHSFTSSPAGSKIVCRHCGVYPTKNPTDCPRFTSHSFMTVRPGIALVCGHCGAAPTGKPVNCPRFTSHSFKEFK